MKSAALRYVEETPVHEPRMTVPELRETEARPRSIGKGVVAGLVGGLIGTFAMNEFQKAWSNAAQAMQKGNHTQAQQGEQESENATMKAAGKIASISGRQLSHEQKKKAGPVVHYSFGTLQGALYGAMTELTRTAGGFLPGVIFGAALFALADEVAVPALGLSGKPSETPASTHVYAAAAHCVYGMATEFARRGLRAAI
ncbi:MAG TPA: DUF1440 domain-containing protein [Terracidiphilus sp.]|nr:DUF1440 domain-containing protein [Terracidiphilus sp.]